jgi:hypothetical protein
MRKKREPKCRSNQKTKGEEKVSFFGEGRLMFSWMDKFQCWVARKDVA